MTQTFSKLVESVKRKIWLPLAAVLCVVVLLVALTTRCQRHQPKASEKGGEEPTGMLPATTAPPQNTVETSTTTIGAIVTMGDAATTTEVCTTLATTGINTATTIQPSTTNSEGSKPSSKETENAQTTKSTATISKCTHGDFAKEYSYLLFGWNSVLPGIENRYELANYEPCTEPWYTIYKCPDCSKAVLYSTRDPLGHNFSGEEYVALHPNVNQEGSYGKTCQRESCNEQILTTSIPKRSGDYSGIDSDFTVEIGNRQCEYYRMESPAVSICDERTWGSVPTITYDSETSRGNISFVDQNGETQTRYFSVDWDNINEGWTLVIRIQETGTLKTYYFTLN